jgi:thymidylate synthase
MNNLDKQYQDLLQDILDNGVLKGDRTGTGTISVFGRQIRHNMKEGFPLLTTKKMPFKSIATELIWFLKGDTNIKFLVDNSCNIWNGDAYKNYLKDSENHEIRWLFSKAGHEEIEDPNDHTQYYRPFTMEEFIDKIKNDYNFGYLWGDLGPIYGAQWRRWYSGISMGNGSNAEGTTAEGKHLEVFNGEVVRNYYDQIAYLVNELRNNPDSRRLMVNAWNVGVIDDMVLPPCHYGFQVYTRELNLNERIEFMIINNIDTTYLNSLSDTKRFDWMDENNIPKRAISLMWNQRSVDTFLGLPFNIASYGLLLEILAKEVNMVPDQLIGNLGDTHLYSNHIEQAKLQIGELEPSIVDENFSVKFEHPKRKRRESYPLPTVKINDSWKFGSSSPVFADKLKLDMFELVDYKSHGTIKAPLSN